MPINQTDWHPPLVFLGPPASGKGTLSRRLAEEAKLDWLSTGALLRSAVRSATPLGKAAEPFLNTGDYVPDEIMLPLVAEWLENRQRPWVLDGFPRTLDQAIGLDSLLGPAADQLRAVNLSVPREILEERITSRLECIRCHRAGKVGHSKVCPACGGPLQPREDDDLARFNRRYTEFEAHTLPAIDHYRVTNRIIELPATAPPDQTFKNLTTALHIESPPSP